jgi:hypothetical protein
MVKLTGKFKRKSAENYDEFLAKGSILQNSIAAKNFSYNFSSSNCGPLSIRKQQI